MNAETAATPSTLEAAAEAPVVATPKRESGAQKKNRLRRLGPPSPLAEDTHVQRGRPRP